MGRGREKGAGEPPWPACDRFSETSMGDPRQGSDNEPDYQQRRAGHRFHYRRRPRSGTRFEYYWTDATTTLAPTLAGIALLPVATVLCCFITLAGVSATCSMTRNVAAESTNPFITTTSLSTDGALRRGTSAIILEATGSDAAPNAPSPGRFSIGAGRRIVCRARASMQSHTPFHRMRLHERPTPLDSLQQLCLVATETPISANSRLRTRLHRTASSCLPASLRPAAPPACRPTCPGRLAWTRPLLCRAAQRLHAGKPCHAGSYGTRQKYHLEENTNKKSPILRCNNAFEEPDGYACASASRMASALPSRPFLRASSRPSSRAPSRTSSGASAVHQQIASTLARAGLKTAINVVHA